jgi:TPR repeat protein
MSLLPRFRSSRARETAALEQRVSTLQTALQQCGQAARRLRTFRREVMAAGAVIMLATGFALGVYREQIAQSVTGAAEAIGLAKPVASLDAASAAYQKGDYPTVQQLARPLAVEGDAGAQRLLALAYYRARGASQDYGEAATWFRRAADQGDANAQFYLGVMSSAGQGMPRDNVEAAKWFRLAGDRGDPEAQYNLGLSYAKGELGEADNVSAYMWFNLAAARFPASDTRRHAAVSARDVVAAKMTQEQIAEAQKRAREWKPQ